MAERVDVVVIGAGVVGLGIARELARAGREVLLLEQHETFGTETSARNSEVIHAGIYYPPGSLKALLCRPGRDLLYDYLETRHVPYLKCGKLIVATGQEEVPALGALLTRGRKNGVDDLELLTGEEARALEPALSCVAAIHSPSSGILDSHLYMLALLAGIENAGGTVAFGTRVIGGAVLEGRILIETDDGTALDAALVVNAAGLWASDVARSIRRFPEAQVPETRFAKGRYFSYSGKAPFGRLIYPLPRPDSQGTHYTRDLGGQGRLGPDIVWGVERGDYDVDEDARGEFFEAARKFWPGLEEDRLHAAYAGIRPKLAEPGEWADWRIDGPREHGVPGLVNLFGIESPGLTASLAIGEWVVQKVVMQS